MKKHDAEQAEHERRHSHSQAARRQRQQRQAERIDRLRYGLMPEQYGEFEQYEADLETT